MNWQEWTWKWWHSIRSFKRFESFFFFFEWKIYRRLYPHRLMIEVHFKTKEQTLIQCAKDLYLIYCSTHPHDMPLRVKWESEWSLPCGCVRAHSFYITPGVDLMKSVPSLLDTDTVNSGYGPTRLMVTFHLMAHPVWEWNQSFSVKTKYRCLLPHSDKG